MRHIAREGRVWVIGVNPCVRVDQIPADFPDRDRVWGSAGGQARPSGSSPAAASSATPAVRSWPGPLRHEEGILTAEIDLDAVASGRRQFDPVGHYNRPDIFSLTVDTRARHAVNVVSDDAPELDQEAGLLRD